MIVGKDIKPERQIYHLGALLLEVLQDTPNRTIELFDVFEHINSHETVSVNAFIRKRQINPIYRKGIKACHDKSNLKEADHDKAIINRATEAETGIMEAAHK